MGGGDKCLAPLDCTHSLLDVVIKRATPQLPTLLLNVNGDHTQFARFDLPLVSDVISGFAGPLAGIHSGMLWMREYYPESRWLMSFAADTPFFPTDLVARCLSAAELAEKPLVTVSSGARSHPVIGLWSVTLCDELESALKTGARKVDRWKAHYPSTDVHHQAGPIDPFFNVNCPEDLQVAQEYWRQKRVS